MEKNKLTAYALNELNESEIKEVENYLSTHPEEKMEVEQIKMLGQILKSELAADYKIVPPPFKLDEPKVSKISAFWKSRGFIAALSFSVIGIISFALLNKMKHEPMVVDSNYPIIAPPVANHRESEQTIGKSLKDVQQVPDTRQDVAQYQNSIAVNSNRPIPKAAIGQGMNMRSGSLSAAGSAGYFGSDKARVLAKSKMAPSSAMEGYGHSFGDTSQEHYESGPENGYLLVSKEPLSTFSIDVDTASYTNARRYLNNGQLPPADAIRSEEFINYFDYDYAAPTSGHPISINMEAVTSPWDKDKVLVRVGLKAKEIPLNERPRSNLVFLIDVSGSMSDENKLPLVKSAMRTLTTQMSENDKISIVVYAGQSGVILDSASAGNKDKIISAINSLSTGGGTNGEGGIRKAYEIAQKNFIKNGNNRVLIATDGDFNVGTTSSEELLRIINDKAENGVFLTVLGFGMGNYKDAFLEKLSDKGQGNYFYIDNEKEANKVFVTQLAGTLYTLAKDVKIQVEFNPFVVESYRLVGYENRMLKKEDFNNDKIDAGELGAGHSVTALYELVMKDKEGSSSKEIPLKYQPSETKKEVEKVPAEKMTEILTAKFRYKKPKNTSSEYFDVALKNNVKSFSDASCSTKFASSVASFSQWLRNSEYVKEVNSDKILKMSEGCLSTKDRKDSYKEEFIELVKSAARLRK